MPLACGRLQPGNCRIAFSEHFEQQCDVWRVDVSLRRVALERVQNLAAFGLSPGTNERTTKVCGLHRVLSYRRGSLLVFSKRLVRPPQ